ncbi:MAG: hypothetical protein OXN83_03065 [Oligoflexia bacterium]|nr:hypothetical protein [Oligoflexia bacterium]
MKSAYLTPWWGLSYLTEPAFHPHKSKILAPQEELNHLKTAPFLQKVIAL